MNNRRLVSLVKNNVCTAWDKVDQVQSMIYLNLDKWKKRKKPDATFLRELLEAVQKILKEEVQPTLLEGRRRLLDEETAWVGMQEICVTIPENVDAKPFLEAANKVTQISSPGSADQ
jgi:hypothetical protein